MVGWALNLPGVDRGARNPEMVKDVLAATDKPVVGFARMIHMVNQTGRDYQDATGMPFLQGLQPTVRALNALWFYSARTGREVPALPAPGGSAANVVDGSQADVTGAALADALAARGITPPESSFAADAGAAADAAQAIGFPVALKIVSPELSHKTEAGGVRLGLGDGAEVAAAAADMADRVAAAGATLDGFLVQEMVDGVEMIVGAREDPLFGPMMVVGAGGVLVELVRDAAFRLLPVSDDDARAMVGELKAARLLDGWRGAPPADVEALVAAIAALSDFFLDHRPWLADLEINPLMVCEKGRGVRAVDIRSIPREG
jgi:acyl-CoA synthetase (NDP forming)